MSEARARERRPLYSRPFSKRCTVMLNFRNSAVFGLAIFFATSACAQDAAQYLCAMDATTGFYFENGSWNKNSFAENRKFLFKRGAAPFEGPSWQKGDMVWQMTEVGKTNPQAYCSSLGSSIICNGVYKVDFDTSTLRILMAYLAGYTQKDSNDDTPTISIGKCSPL
jgi:hypothetical protein